MCAKDQHQGAGYLDGLIAWLAGTDGEKIVAAAILLSRVGPALVGFLLLEAAKASTTDVHAYRLLSLASAIGGRRGAVENHCLRLLKRHRCPAVRTKAREAMAVLTPQKAKRRSGMSIQRA